MGLNHWLWCNWYRVWTYEIFQMTNNEWGFWESSHRDKHLSDNPMMFEGAD